MPLVDGFEATRRIRRHEAQAGLRAVPIAALTANACGADRAECAAAGMDEYVTKPCPMDRLHEMLRRLHALDIQRRKAARGPQ
jgi:CheY-like chemotaxis protein